MQISVSKRGNEMYDSIIGGKRIHNIIIKTEKNRKHFIENIEYVFEWGVVFRVLKK